MKWIGLNGKYWFKAEIWESNKGQLGYCAWSLKVFVPDLAVWYMLEGSHRDYPLHPDTAHATASYEFIRALSGEYDDRIQNDVGVEPRGGKGE